AGCDRVMHQIVGIRGAVAGLMAEVVEDHVRNHLVTGQENAVRLDAQAAEQLIDVVHSYLK
ncbi:MAG TPA: metal-sensing transcriptional repressor, partial [Xanthobacteraceae bacterium]|nr:metal-sensing transcriptional repressor [Xanthobacteraceae bacterium]